MSKDKSLGGFDVGVTSYETVDFPSSEYAVLDRSEYESDSEVATDFLSPCLGLIGFSEDYNENVYGAHIGSPTGHKVEGFLERYNPDYVIATGINYDQGQLETHNNQENRLNGVVGMEPIEVFEAISSSVSSVEELTAIEDTKLKRGSVERALEESDVEHITEWANEPANFSTIEASAQDQSIEVKHFDI